MNSNRRNARRSSRGRGGRGRGRGGRGRGRGGRGSGNTTPRTPHNPSTPRAPRTARQTPKIQRNYVRQMSEYFTRLSNYCNSRNYPWLL